MPGFTVPAHIDSLVVITVVLSLFTSLVTPFATAIYRVFDHEAK